MSELQISKNMCELLDFHFNLFMFTKSFHFCLRFKGFVNKISHLLYTNKQYQYLLKITYLTFSALTLKEKRNKNSRGYITKLGFDQNQDLSSGGKSCDTVHLESQLGKVPGSVSTP